MPAAVVRCAAIDACGWIGPRIGDAVRRQINAPIPGYCCPECGGPVALIAEVDGAGSWTLILDATGVWADAQAYTERYPVGIM